VSHPAYLVILPPGKENIRPRVAIFARKDTKYSYTARPDITIDPDILVLQISGPGLEPFYLINLYNEESLGNSNKWTIQRTLQYLEPEERTIICGDFNAHHSWWNSTVYTPSRCAELIPWLEKYGFELKNSEDQVTFKGSNTNNLSVIDLTFATRAIEADIDNWYIDKEADTGSDHEVIRFSIYTELTENFIYPLKADKYNLEKAN
jgi:hypothetical protein